MSPCNRTTYYTWFNGTVTQTQVVSLPPLHEEHFWSTSRGKTSPIIQYSHFLILLLCFSSDKANNKCRGFLHLTLRVPFHIAVLLQTMPRHPRVGTNEHTSFPEKQWCHQHTHVLIGAHTGGRFYWHSHAMAARCNSTLRMDPHGMEWYP